MPDRPDHGRRAYDTPSVLGLVVDTLNRVESKLDQGLARVEAQLDGKADRSDLAALTGELRGHAGRITALEREEDLRRAKAQVHQERDQRAFFTLKNKWAIIATALTVVATVVLAAATVVQVFS